MCFIVKKSQEQLETLYGLPHKAFFFLDDISVFQCFKAKRIFKIHE